MKRIFTYGTLMRGFGLNELLETSRFISEDSLKGALYDLSLGTPYSMFPGITDGDDWIPGEIYEIDDEGVFNRINQIETGSGYSLQLGTTMGGRQVHYWRYEKLPRRIERWREPGKYLY